MSDTLDVSTVLSDLILSARVQMDRARTIIDSAHAAAVRAEAAREESDDLRIERAEQRRLREAERAERVVLRRA